MRQPLFEHRLELAGAATRALELEGEGPPLVFVHGYADSADTWRLVLERCAREGRRAIAIDLPGYGEADRLKDGPVLPQYDALVGELIERVADEAGEPVVLAGNSLGGVIALRLGADTTLPLLGIAPVAPAGLEMPRWFTAIERDVVLRTVLASPVPIPEAIVRLLLGQVYRQLAFSRPSDAPDELVRMFTSHHPSVRSLNHVLAMGRRLLPELQSPPPIAAIRVPVLLVGRPRPDGHTPRVAAGARSVARDRVRRAGGLRPLPAAGGSRAPVGRAARVPAGDRRREAPRRRLTFDRQVVSHTDTNWRPSGQPRSSGTLAN